jgi:deazaflavin-dependent oxidoreductase (nitroreductase family)
LLTVTGRKTGTRRTTPVSYVRDGDLAFLTTGDRWVRNLSGGAPVEIRIRGRWLAGDATPVTDRGESVATHQRLFRAHPWFRALSGLPAAGRDGADPVALEQTLSAGRTLVRISLRPR